MAFNDELANRTRVYLGAHPRFNEKKMFSGLTFLLDGKITVGVMKDQLMVRGIASKEAELLSQDGVSEMKFTGKARK
ncbi:MAG: TfoX/Sxy family transcriptional regulator of competence genes [Chitinophagales bacterium]|jgi:TfoX/Sxy family transcriptional regulator of competence genes